MMLFGMWENNFLFNTKKGGSKKIWCKASAELEINEKVAHVTKLKTQKEFIKLLSNNLLTLSILTLSLTFEAHAFHRLIECNQFGAAGQNRTGTGVSPHRILSPVCLPISPQQQRKFRLTNLRRVCPNGKWHDINQSFLKKQEKARSQAPNQFPLPF